MFEFEGGDSLLIAPHRSKLFVSSLEGASCTSYLYLFYRFIHLVCFHWILSHFHQYTNFSDYLHWSLYCPPPGQTVFFFLFLQLNV